MHALDHAIILTADLIRAASQYRRLGFSLTPRGTHPTLGTANHTIMLERDYLELLSVVAPSPANERWRQRLALGDGIAGIALATDDATATHANLTSRGVEAEAPIHFARPVGTADGTRDARFTVVMLPTSTSPAIPGFFCQHHTRELVWRPEALWHPNGARAVSGITVLADEPEAHLGAYERWLGSARIHPRVGGLTITLGATQIWIVSRSYASVRLGRDLSGPAGPLGLTVAVPDLEATKRVLAANAVPFRRFGRASVLVEPTFAAGVFLEFLTG